MFRTARTSTGANNSPTSNSSSFRQYAELPPALPVLRTARTSTSANNFPASSFSSFH